MLPLGTGLQISLPPDREGTGAHRIGGKGQLNAPGPARAESGDPVPSMAFPGRLLVLRGLFSEGLGDGDSSSLGTSQRDTVGTEYHPTSPSWPCRLFFLGLQLPWGRRGRCWEEVPWNKLGHKGKGGVWGCQARPPHSLFTEDARSGQAACSALAGAFQTFWSP